MLIDCHMHINFNNVNSNNIINYLNRNKIDLCWLMTWEERNINKWPYQHLNLNNILEAHQKYPDRIKIMYAPDPLDENFDKKFKKNKDYIFGYGELKSIIKWKDKNITKLLNLIKKLKIPLNFHMENQEWKFIEFNKNNLLGKYANKYIHSKIISKLSNKTLSIIDKYFKIDNFKYTYYFPGYMLDFSNLELRLQQYPDVIFIAHGPYFWANISTNSLDNKYPKGPIHIKGIISRLLEKYNNLYVDISGVSGYNALVRDKCYSKKFIEKFNSKLLFGTDTYELNQKDFIESLNISKEYCNNIFYKNAINIMDKTNGK